MRCVACRELLDFDDPPPNQKPGQWQDAWYCFDCWNELANGIVNVRHMHTAKLYSAGNPSQPEPNPSQENAIRAMEDGS